MNWAAGVNTRPVWKEKKRSTGGEAETSQVPREDAAEIHHNAKPGQEPSDAHANLAGFTRQKEGSLMVAAKV